ncbi:MAG: hypothetical protein KY467_01145 [Gemmatimonadetes bacterium]|nr:hypothetical protein [Gemmatimonadota bacterium]
MTSLRLLLDALRKHPMVRTAEIDADPLAVEGVLVVLTTGEAVRYAALPTPVYTPTALTPEMLVLQR